MGPVGMPEMIMIFIVVLLLFGAKKLPELAIGIGKSMGEYKKARDDFEREFTFGETEAKKSPGKPAPHEDAKKDVESSAAVRTSNMRCALVDFWISEKSDGKFFKFLKGGMDIEMDDQEPEVAFCSCFGKNHVNVRKEATLIQYLGENVRPDLKTYHASMSFDRFEDSKQMRLPLYLLEREWYDLMMACNSREAKLSLQGEERKFCGALVSNGRTGARKQFMELLIKRGLLESGGKEANNIGQVIPANESIYFRREYRFFLAFENSSHPGYVTEKILGAMAAGCIPVYWGAPDVGLDFNETAFINGHRYKGWDAVIARMQEINDSPTELAAVLAEPWLTPEQEKQWGMDAVRERVRLFVIRNVAEHGNRHR